jgi:hypothetical protein
MKPTKSKLGNPVVAAEVISQTASVIPFLVKLGAIIAVTVVGYKMWTNRFVSLKENSSYPASNISLAEAKTRADSIIGSIGWVSNDFNAVSKQLSGLNYNGFIRVYNAFGHQRGTLLAGELNLVEWIKNQFTDYQIQQLSFLLGGAFLN